MKRRRNERKTGKQENKKQTQLTQTLLSAAFSTFVSPALHEVHVSFHACDRPVAEQPSRTIRTAHIVTPETSTSTHYLIYHGRDFALEDSGVTDFMHRQLRVAFQEDIDGLEAIERNLARYAPGSVHEISFRADGPSLAMRRWLKRRAKVIPSPLQSAEQ